MARALRGRQGRVERRRRRGVGRDEGGQYLQRALASGGSLGDVNRRERDDLSETEQEGSLQLDYTRPLGRFDLEAGYKGSLRRLDSEQRFVMLEPSTGAFQADQVNAFDFDEQVHGAYGMLSTELGPFSVKAGLRAEQALTTFTLRSTGEGFDNDYFSLYPSAFLTSKPSEIHQVSLSYSKRVDRPSLWQINPFSDNEDPNFRRIGNPFLDPEYIHSFELKLVRHWNAVTITASPYFRHTVNEIERRETIDENGVTTLTFENFSTSNSYGTELITTLQMKDWVRGNVTLNGYRTVTDASNVDTDLSNNALAFTARANLTFDVRPGLDLQLSQFYRSPIDIAGGRIDERVMTNVGLRQDLFGGDASIDFQARDVFSTMGFDIRRRLDTFAQETSFSWDARQFQVTFTYNFGGEPGRRQRDRDSPDGGDGGEEVY